MEALRKEVTEFMDKNDIPYHIPREFEPEDYYDKGVIKGKDLKHGCYYLGKCRNANIGRWDAEKEVMWYKNYTFGHFVADNVNYIDNDNHFDLFMAFREMNEDEVPEERKVERFLQ